MNLLSLLKKFNPSKFIVYNCLLIFTMLLALRLDEKIKISYWIIFIPLWIWKGLVIVGALIGTIVWCKNPLYRISDSSYIHFKSMLISLSIQLLLLMFELLACDKLESGRHLWTLAFVPLIFISLLSIAICVWEMKNDRSFEMELFCSVNIIQFIFIAMRLDNFILWSWIVVFIPLWIIMCLSIIGVFYALIFSAILLRTSDVSSEQRNVSLHTAISYFLIVVPLLIFLILLCNKIDTNSMLYIMYDKSSSTMSYFTVFIPLYFTFIVLMCLSFGSKRVNSWWFGIRKDFCTFLLTTCPCLREYGNISYSKESVDNNANSNNNNNLRQLEDNPDQLENNLKFIEKIKSIQEHSKKSIVPRLVLESPD